MLLRFADGVFFNFLLYAARAVSGLSSTVASAGDLGSLIRSEVDQCDTRAGVGIAVVVQDQAGNEYQKNASYAGAFGSKNLEQNQPADKDTLFCVGSVTKQFTAVLLLELLDMLQSKNYSYSLATLVTDLDESLDFPGSGLTGMTIEDILTHRTGLAEVYGPFLVGYPASLSSQDLATIAAKLPRLWPPRDHFEYNNHVYAVSGYVCELLGAIYYSKPVTWEYLLRTVLLDPLGMSSGADFSEPNTQYFARAAVPYHTVNRKYIPVDRRVAETIRPGAAAGALCLSPAAMALWLEFLLGRGTFRGQEIVKTKTIEETWRPRTAFTKDGDLSKDGVGLAWRVENQSGSRVASLAGMISTYRSIIAVNLDKNVSYFASSAGGYAPNSMALISNVKAKIFEDSQSSSASARKTCGPIVVPPNPDSSKELPVSTSLYKGTFTHPLYGDLQIAAAKGSALTLTTGAIGQGQVRCVTSDVLCRMSFQGPLEYLSNADDSVMASTPVKFTKSCSGYVVNVTLPFYSENVPAVFTRTPPPDEKCARAASSGVGNFCSLPSAVIVLALPFVRGFV